MTPRCYEHLNYFESFRADRAVIVDRFDEASMPEIKVAQCLLPAGHVTNHVAQLTNGDVKEWARP